MTLILGMFAKLKNGVSLVWTIFCENDMFTTYIQLFSVESSESAVKRVCEIGVSEDSLDVSD